MLAHGSNYRLLSVLHTCVCTLENCIICGFISGNFLLLYSIFISKNGKGILISKKRRARLSYWTLCSKIIFENISCVVKTNDVNLFLFSHAQCEHNLNTFLSIFKINFNENELISFENFQCFVKFFLFSLSEKERRFVVFNIDSICENINKKWRSVFKWAIFI